MDTIRTSVLLEPVLDFWLRYVNRRCASRRAELARLLFGRCPHSQEQRSELRSTNWLPSFNLPRINIGCAPGFMSRFLLLALCCIGLPAAAQDASGQGAPLGEEWQPIDPARLAGMRGGLLMPSGTVLSFGIERVVHVNGQLVASVSVRIPDIARIDSTQAQALADFNQGILVQVGEGNRFDPSRIPGGVVIQNTLDNQNISTATYIDVGAGTLDAFQNLNSNAALTDALIRAPGTP